METAHDALEFILAGATTVGLGTGLFYDPMAAKKINTGISQYLKSHNLGSVDKLVGKVF